MRPCIVSSIVLLIPLVTFAQAADKPATPIKTIQPPGGVPVIPSGATITSEMVKTLTKRLESAPGGELDKWVTQLERAMNKKLNGLANNGCRTCVANRLTVMFDNDEWNASKAARLLHRIQSMPAAVVQEWKQALEVVLGKEIGQSDQEVFDGGPAYAVPLVLAPVDSLFKNDTYDSDAAKKYLARLKQLNADEVALWKTKVDQFGGSHIDAAMNIVLLDDYFSGETFLRAKFSTAGQ